MALLGRWAMGFVHESIPGRAGVVDWVAGQWVEDGPRIAGDALVADLAHHGR